MVSAIPQATAKCNVPAATLWERWNEYSALLVWDETLREPGSASSDCCDPKDLPYVLLERKIGANGTLTKDPHIAKLGGHPLTLDFVLSARGYARTVVVAVNAGCSASSCH
jgi:hypothetical protein